ncbi:expressed protein [Phakopsora pachyrhizi]|uniref:Expressed protein n=1 Tax=Phakopsora pachyrhizi TaxID=170000 RepID=A0AAV0AYT8_PHAPC|nr:expressed protein [Phakopsora pachyrhizi]
MIKTASDNTSSRFDADDEQSQTSDLTLEYLSVRPSSPFLNCSPSHQKARPVIISKRLNNESIIRNDPLNPSGSIPPFLNQPGNRGIEDQQVRSSSIPIDCRIEVDQDGLPISSQRLIEDLDPFGFSRAEESVRRLWNKDKSNNKKSDDIFNQGESGKKSDGSDLIKKVIKNDEGLVTLGSDLSLRDLLPIPRRTRKSNRDIPKTLKKTRKLVKKSPTTQNKIRSKSKIHKGDVEKDNSQYRLNKEDTYRPSSSSIITKAKTVSSNRTSKSTSDLPQTVTTTNSKRAKGSGDCKRIFRGVIIISEREGDQKKRKRFDDKEKVYGIMTSCSSKSGFREALREKKVIVNIPRLKKEDFLNDENADSGCSMNMKVSGKLPHPGERFGGRCLSDEADGNLKDIKAKVFRTAKPDSKNISAQNKSGRSKKKLNSRANRSEPVIFNEADEDELTVDRSNKKSVYEEGGERAMRIEYFKSLKGFKFEEEIVL